MGFPIFATLSFSAPGVTATLDNTRQAFGKLKGEVKSLNESLGKIGEGIKGATLATAPMAAGVALATKTFAGFEQQMSIVRSLTGNISNQVFGEMNAEAKRLGATTSFSALQAAQGFQFLALAGFNAQDQIGSLESVLNLAAAGSLDLGLASDIATDSLSALAPAFDDPAKKVENLSNLVNKFALIQSKTNTNVQQLGEAVKYGGGTLASFGVPLDEIIASMGALANAGLKGSMGGTSLMNMFNQIISPTEKAKQIMSELGISVADANGKLLPIPKLVEHLTTSLNKIKSPTQKAEAAVELFGIRGIRAFNSLENEGSASLQKLIDMSAGASQGMGSAMEQAKIRLDNLAGTFDMWTSAVEGVLIEIGALFAGFIRGPIQLVADNIGFIAQAFQIATGQVKEGTKAYEAFFSATGAEKGQAMLDFVNGFIDGFNEAKTTIVNTFRVVSATFNDFFGSTGMTTKEVGKLVSKILIFGAIAAPILATVATALFALGPILSGLSGTIGLITSSFGILKASVMIGVNLLSTFGLTGAAIFTKVGAFMKAAGLAMSIWGSTFSGFLGALFGGFAKLSIIFGAVFTKIGAIGAAIFSLKALAIGAIAGIVAGVVGGFVNVFNKFEEIKAAFRDGFIPGMLKLGTVFAEGFWAVISWPFKKAAGLMSKIGGFLGFGGESQTPGIVPTPGATQPGQTNLAPTTTAAPQIVNSSSGIETDVRGAQAAAAQQTGLVTSAPPQTVIQQAASQASSSEIKVESKLIVDGEVLARAVSRKQVENAERKGVNLSPGEKAMMLRKGATAIKGAF